jgi:uncharacterized protein
MPFLACSGSHSSIRLNLRHIAMPLFCLAAATFFPTAISAQSQVELGSNGGRYHVNVMSWADIPFRSIVRQRYDFSCGSAAVATLLTYHYGRPTPEQLPFSEMWKAGDQKVITKSGFSLFDMKNYFQSIGLRAEGYRMNVDDLRKSKRPAIVLLDLNGFKHFVVVKGVQGNTVLVGDPIRGLEKYEAKEFQKSWNGIALAIVNGATKERPSFNIVRDWAPWSTAPIDANAQIANISDLTTNLPPTYQLTTQIQIAARVGTGKE